mmetsp:Transcript_29008/g.42960  ORF Transcript_29008/g.42960 Transcript_29008/m.42960 type:complete len:155 (-) Transcript_29008:594-1058(-)
MMIPKTQTNLIFLLIGIALGVMFSWQSWTQDDSESTRTGGRGAQDDGGQRFVLGVTATFVSVEHKREFVRLFRPVAEYVKQQEKTTLSYELLFSDKDELRIYIFEQYENKSSYLNIHKRSAEFLSFRADLQGMLDKKHAALEGESYLVSGLGFL